MTYVFSLVQLPEYIHMGDGNEKGVSGVSVSQPNVTVMVEPTKVAPMVWEEVAATTETMGGGGLLVAREATGDCDDQPKAFRAAQDTKHCEL